MNISIIGAGSMGLLFGGYLSKKHNVSLICRTNEKAKKVLSGGIVIKETNEDENTFYPNASADSTTLPPQDLVILFVKSGDSQEALENNRHLIGKDTFLLTLQNGAGHEELLSKYSDLDHILIGTTNQGSFRLSDTSVCHSGGGDTAFGCLSGNNNHCEKIADAFRECGFPCQTTSEIKKMIWNKLMINASSSVLSGLMQTAQGYVASNEYLWSVAQNLIREMCAAACADSCEFNADEQIKRVYNHLKKAPNGYTSVYADLKNGRKTEVRKINGAVIDAARRLNIPVPTHETILALVIAAEQKNK